MPLAPSPSVPWRVLQAIRDLRYVAEGATRATLGRIAAVIPPAGDPRQAEETLRGLVLRGRARITTDAEAALHPHLLLAATLPDDDVDAFSVATATLLADRLQRGRGGRRPLLALGRVPPPLPPAGAAGARGDLPGLRACAPHGARDAGRAARAGRPRDARAHGRARAPGRRRRGGGVGDPARRDRVGGRRRPRRPAVGAPRRAAAPRSGRGPHRVGLPPRLRAQPALAALRGAPARPRRALGAAACPRDVP